MAGRRVAVTGLGLVDPFGGDTANFFSHLLAGRSAIAADVSGSPPHHLPIPAVRCRDFDAETRLGRPLAHMLDRYGQLGAASVLAAWEDAGLPLTEPAPQRPDCGIAWGTAVGGTTAFEIGYRQLYLNGQKRVPPLSLLHGMNSSAASQIAIRLGLGGSCLTYSVACASASAAIGEAMHAIRDGRATMMVAGGSEAPLAYGVVRAWQALRVLAPGDERTAATACRPFSRDRAGLVLGEGAGALVLEDWDHARARGARIHAELAGYGASCDHFHAVRPDPAGQVRAMRQALEDGGLTPDEVDYVNAHGTATREGDIAEIAALTEIFADRAAFLPVSATKSMHGHMLGASGAVEAIVAILALSSGSIPPTANLEDVDPACAGIRHVTGAPLTGQRLRAALSNAFAFGGSNAVLAFRAVPPDGSAP